VSTLGTYEVNLTGIFTATSWQITGGSATFSDPGFLCQQGGFSSPPSILCLPSNAGGGYQANGAHLSFGVDPDGSDPGATSAGEITVFDDTGSTIVATLAGVLADVTIDAGGNLITNSGEFRRARYSTACPGGGLRYDGIRITCGQFSAGSLALTGTATVVPVPATVWLLGGALAVLGALRRRNGFGR
jgi:hypothetical protein